MMLQKFPRFEMRIFVGVTPAGYRRRYELAEAA